MTADLVALPPRNPRWLVPRAGGGAAKYGMTLYAPSRPLPFALARLVGSLFSSRPASAVIGRLGGDPGAYSSSLAVGEAALVDATNGEASQFAAWTGAPGPCRKITVAGMNAGARPLAFAKVAHEPLAREAVEREAKSLAIAGEVCAQTTVPCTLTIHRDDRHTALVITALEGQRLRNAAELDGRHALLMHELRQARGHIHPDYVANLRRRAASLENCAASVRELLEDRISATSSWFDETALCFAHGDLTPWNCVELTDALGVLDWEAAGPKPPYWDLFHYVHQVETHARRGSISRAAERLASQKVTDLIAGLVDRVSPGLLRELQVFSLAASAVEMIETRPVVERRGIAIRIEALRRCAL